MQKKAPDQSQKHQIASQIDSFRLLDTLVPAEFDHIAQLAALVCKSPANSVILAGKNRQWFKFQQGEESNETPEDVSICFELMQEETKVIPDLAKELKFRFFASVPLFNKKGEVFASLCIVDDSPHQLTPVQVRALETISDQLTNTLEARREQIENQRSRGDLLSAERSLTVFKQVLDSSVDAITIADLTQPDEPIIYMNQAFEELSGYSTYDVLGRNCRFMQGKDTNQPVIKELREAVKNRTYFKGLIKNYRKDGTPFWNELSLMPIKDEDGIVSYMLGEQRDKSIVKPGNPTKKTSRRSIGSGDSFEGMVGTSPIMKALFEQIESIAQVDASVLIEGETGTGKELVAKAIHKRSPRAGKPFIAMNCGGISETLLTSQLFGHKRGSFTGAIDNSQGVFEAANHGTIFLDEVGDMPMPLQMALLRVLQEKEVTRIGENTPRKVNVRVIAATHRNMADLVKAGTFREDLYYRIKVAPISLPPLRERKDDVLAIAQNFISDLNQTSTKTLSGISSEAMKALVSHNWPGNVRELRSAIEYAFIQCKGHEIEVYNLPPEISTPQDPVAKPNVQALSEKDRIEEALKQTGGNRNAAAKLLGMSRATFFRRLAKLKDSS